MEEVPAAPQRPRPGPTARFLIAFALASAIASLGLAPIASAAPGYESGDFPSRLFYVTRSPGGPPRDDAYATSVTSPVAALWWLRVESLAGSGVVVEVSHEDESGLAVDVSIRLRAPGQETPPLRLEPGRPYGILMTPVGRAGTSILSEGYRASQPPLACFDMYPSLVAEGDFVRFDASCSSDPDGDIVGYAWDFGDGSSATGLTADHNFLAPGDYIVSLRVRDPDGNVGETSRTVSVVPRTTRLFPPHTDAGVDEDGDGLLDALLVNVRLAVGNSDYYTGYYGLYFTVQGSLRLTEEIALWQEVFSGYSPGVYNVTLRFAGAAIRIAGVPGPYTVDLTLVYSPTNMVVGREPHATAAYEPAAFEDSPARFEPPHTDTAVDVDGDARFDELVLEIGVQIREPTSANVWVDLFSVDGTRWIASQSTTGSFDAGWTSVWVGFDGAELNTSRIDGPYLARFAMYIPSVGIVVDKGEWETRAYRAHDFGGPAASFWPPHSDRGVDEDGDGLFEALEVDVGLAMTVAGSYRIYASLAVPVNETSAIYLVNTDAFFQLGVGVQRVSIRFDSEPINESGLDGPYVIFLWLSDGCCYLDQDEHRTAEYASSQFRGPPARLADEPTDRGEDTDGDGYFNYLLVEIPVNVWVRSEFLVSGRIESPCCSSLTAANTSELDPGPHRIGLRFDGVDLRTFGFTTSYAIQYELYDNATRRQLGSGRYMTGTYAYTQFEPPPGRFSPPHTEYGLDTDGDGRFNFLVVEAVVEVVDADLYTVSGELRIGYYDYRGAYATNTRKLGPGVHRLELRFDGTLVSISRQNASHSVSLRLWSQSHETILDRSTFSTRFYEYAAFEEIPFALAPPHRDYGEDTDGDGLYNALVLEVALSALSDGFVSMNAVLYTGRGTAFASNATTVVAGSATILLRFHGATIREQGVDGPYWVEFTLNAADYGELERGVHTTQSYRAAAFDPSLAIDISATRDRGEDPNGNGLYDSLAIDVALELEFSGTFVVSAVIRFNAETYLGGYAELNLEAGRRTAVVRLSGMAIAATGIDGPYIVNLSVYRLFSGLRADAAYTTAPYAAAAFEPPSATLVAPFSEEPVDRDGNALYDILRLTVTVDVRSAGNYTVVACLDVVPTDFRVVDVHVGILEAGIRTVALELPGGQIRVLGADGPYTVALGLFPTPPGTTSPEWVVRASFETRAYRADEFDYLVVFGAITDRGVDLDGNGRYNYLEVEVELLFKEAGWFTLVASLELDPYPAYWRLEGPAEPGNLVVNFTFEAWRFNASGQDGPYRIRLTAFALGVIVERVYLTAAYRAADFE